MIDISWEAAGVILGSVGTVTGVASLYVSVRSASASESSARSSEVSANQAVESNSLTRAEWTRQNQARLEWVGSHFGWKQNPDDNDRGKFTIAVRNEGLATAYEPSCSGYYHLAKHMTYGGSPIGAVDERQNKVMEHHTSEVIFPGDVVLFWVDAPRNAFGIAEKRNVTFRIHYRDPLGEHRTDFKFWFHGKWEDSGFGRYSPVSECRDGVLRVISPQRAPEFTFVEGEVELPCEALRS